MGHPVEAKYTIFVLKPTFLCKHYITNVKKVISFCSRKQESNTALKSRIEEIFPYCSYLLPWLHKWPKTINPFYEFGSHLALRRRSISVL